MKKFREWFININLVVALCLQLYIFWSTHAVNKARESIELQLKHRMPTINGVAPKSNLTV